MKKILIALAAIPLLFLMFIAGVFYYHVFFPSSYIGYKLHYNFEYTVREKLKKNNKINLADFCSEDFDKIIISSQGSYLKDLGYDFSDDLNSSASKIYYMKGTQVKKIIKIDYYVSDEEDMSHDYVSFFHKNNNDFLFFNKDDAIFSCTNMDEKAKRSVRNILFNTGVKPFKTYYLKH